MFPMRLSSFHKRRTRQRRPTTESDRGNRQACSPDLFYRHGPTSNLGFETDSFGPSAFGQGEPQRGQVANHCRRPIRAPQQICSQGVRNDRIHLGCSEVRGDAQSEGPVSEVRAQPSSRTRGHTQGLRDSGPRFNQRGRKPNPAQTQCIEARASPTRLAPRFAGVFAKDDDTGSWSAYCRPRCKTPEGPADDGDLWGFRGWVR